MRASWWLLVVAGCNYAPTRLGDDVPSVADEPSDGVPSDAAIGIDALVCPGGYTENAFGSCYRIVTTPLSWQAAEAECETTTGAHLVVVDNGLEDAALPTATEHWIGYSETVAQGTYLWVTGAGVGFERWAPTEPDSLADAYCATTRPDAWHDDNCFELKRSVCELDGVAADPAAWQ
jgi:hypothetical protein